jgi:hypothetical protein
VTEEIKPSMFSADASSSQHRTETLDQAGKLLQQARQLILEEIEDVEKYQANDDPDLVQCPICKEFHNVDDFWKQLHRESGKHKQGR